MNRDQKAAVVDEIHRKMEAMLSAGGAHIDAYYYCPHHPDGKVAGYARACDCRKPGAGGISSTVRFLACDASEDGNGL